MLRLLLLPITMTVKKKLDGELQEVKSSFTTSGFRWALIVLVASMHPIGRSLLGQMGFVLPDQASEKRVQEEITQVKTDLADVKKEVGSVKTKVETLDNKFTGFQVDFNRFKK